MQNSQRIEKCINLFLDGKGKSKGLEPDERYASFDYCYNYFYSFYKQDKIAELASQQNMQMSCLQLGFYLASWGMMRASSSLPQKSARNYMNLILAISKMNVKLWEIDVDQYDDKNIEILLNCRKQIKIALGLKKEPTDTLITKIMLGVFANIPAFDKYFRKTFKIHRVNNVVNEKNLKKISSFYSENRAIFDSFEIYTFDFLTSAKTNILYTKAKLLDMYGFIAGQEKR